MNNKIEEGCRAIIVNSEAGNNGIVVTVGKKRGASKIDYGNGRYSKENYTVWFMSEILENTSGEFGDFIFEYQLQRLPYDGNEKTTWEAMKDVWTPNEILVNG